MSEFREASAAVDALEARLALLREPLQQEEGDGDAFEAKEQALRLLLEAVHGATNELVEKFRARCAMVDPITKEPRFGPKMLARVQGLLQRYDAIKDTIETTDLVAQIEQQAARRREQQQEQEKRLEQERLKAQEAEAARLRALEEQRVREEAEERQSLALEHAKEQQRIAALAVLAQQKREERERVREEEAKRVQEEQERIARTNAAIPVGNEGLERAIEMLRESTGSADKLRQSLQKLHILVSNICNSPENIAFRHIPRGNAHFHSDLGQYKGGHQCLFALGFKEVEPEEGVVVFTLEEPDLSVDLDAWSDWFDSLKAMSEFISSQLQG
ncbi:Dynein light chain [Globisporangium polare]